MEQLTLFQEDFPANHTHQQGKGLGKRTQDISGRKCLEQFEKFNRVGLWAKTFADLLIGMEGWYSMKCSLSWKLRATKSHRFYFQLVPSTHLTEGIEFSLLPTVTCMDSTNATATMKSTQVKEGSMHSVTLTRAMAMGMLPTPTTRDSKAGQSPSGMTRKDGKSRADQLNNLPVMLGKHTQQTGEISQQLNPQFVLEMMGFPVDWTELPFLNGETSQSKQQVTQ